MKLLNEFSYIKYIFLVLKGDFLKSPFLFSILYKKYGFMDINEYQSSIRNFVTYPKEIGVFYNLFEMSAAFGDLSKKVNETLISNKEFDRNQSLRFAISLGDILNAISNFALDIGVSMDEVIALNLKKIAVLKERQEKEQNNKPIKLENENR